MPRPATPSQPPSLATIGWRWRAFAVAVVAIVGIAIALDQAAAGNPYADDVVDQDNVTNAGDALGLPDGDDAMIGADGFLIVSFDDNPVADGAGDDLTLHLSDTGDGTAEVFVSANGVDYSSVGTTNDLADASFDINSTGLSAITSVRIEYDSGTGDFDVDAIEAIYWHTTGEISIIDANGGGLVDGNLVQVRVYDPDENQDPNAAETLTVQIESDSDGPVALQLTESGNDTNEFVGYFRLGDELSAQPDEEVTATYTDEHNVDNEVEDVADSIPVTDEEDEQAKATICHRPPGNPGNQKTLEVGGEAYAAHLAHGDIAGECAEPIAPTKAEQAAERRDERNEARAAEREERDAAFCDKHGADHPRCDEEDGGGE